MLDAAPAMLLHGDSFCPATHCSLLAVPMHDVIHHSRRSTRCTGKESPPRTNSPRLSAACLVMRQGIAQRLGRWSRGGASAERMFRTLTDPGYQKATNKHGRRLNKRGGTPMHVMAAYALRQLPGREGNLTQVLPPSTAVAVVQACSAARS